MKLLLLVLTTALSLFLATDVYPSCISLTWTASGDDGYEGVAHSYDIRFSEYYITEANWDGATCASFLKTPSKSGTQEYVVLGGFEPGRMYYFGVKVLDESGNCSSLSNVIAKVAPQPLCTGTVGNVDCDPQDRISISDLAMLVSHLFQGGPLCCPMEANIDGDPDGNLTIGDVSLLIEHLFINPRSLPWCR